jgi:hypothetical protein
VLELATLLETSVAFEAEVLLQILSWNGIERVISQDTVSNQFRVAVREGHKKPSSQRRGSFEVGPKKFIDPLLRRKRRRIRQGSFGQPHPIEWSTLIRESPTVD